MTSGSHSVEFDKKMEGIFKAAELLMHRMKRTTFIWGVLVLIGAICSVANFILLHRLLTKH